MENQIKDESALSLKNNYYKTSKKPYGTKINWHNKSKAKTGEETHCILDNFHLHQLGTKAEKELRTYFSQALKIFLKANNFSTKSSVFLIGLGNSKYSADSLGKRVLSKVLMSRGLLSKSDYLADICGIVPNIYANTGIETYDIIKAVKKEVNPDIVIVIDSLATENISRLCCSFQISNGGIIPGEAMGSGAKEISEKNLKVPVITIGVPLLFMLKKDNDTFYLTTHDIEKQMRVCARIIAKSLNSTIHKYLKNEELQDLLY